MKYTNFKYEFIERTLEDVERYVGNYEVTALLNSCVGLLIIPQQTLFDKVPNYPIGKYGLDTSLIKLKNGRKNSIKPVVRHIRNSISHGNFTQGDCFDGKISAIRFQDYDFSDIKTKSEENMTFEMFISVEGLRNFVINFAKDVLNTKDGE